MTIRKFWIGFSCTIAVIFFSAFSQSLFKLQSLSQDIGYIKDQMSSLDLKFETFIRTEARFHADKKETYELISLLISTNQISKSESGIASSGN